MIYYDHMYLSSADLLHFVLSICAVCVTIFLCWALYELMKVLRQTDEMVTEFRERLSLLENAIDTLQERFLSISNIFGVVAKTGSQLMSFVGDKTESKKRTLRKKLEDLAEEE